jgi:hypothetical protein
MLKADLRSNHLNFRSQLAPALGILSHFDSFIEDGHSIVWRVS